MSRVVNPSRPAEPADIDGVLRRPDGSFDIAAYAKLAHRARAAAIASAVRNVILTVRSVLSAIGTRLSPVASSGPASGKHHAHFGR